jgi:hypothetical protein
MEISARPISLEEYRFIVRHDFMSFVQAVFYELNPHTAFKLSPFLEFLAAKLEACRRGEIKRLIINLPPRSLKSPMISVAFPAWLLGHHPGTEIMCASYGQELADKLARDTRRVVASPWYRVLFKTRLAERIAVHDFETGQKGGRFATSSSSTIPWSPRKRCPRRSGPTSNNGTTTRCLAA